LKKVLIISSHFAPDAHIGAKRITKFCRYLPQHGWQPIVLTSAISDYFKLDETMMDQLPEDFEVHRVNKCHIISHNNKTSQSSSNSKAKIGHNKSNLFRRILGKVFHSVEFLEFSWLFPAFIQCRQIIQNQNIDVIFSSSPNPESHVVALLLSFVKRIPFVCEYRDPWTNQPPPYRKSILLEKVNIKIEKIILKRVNRIIIVSQLMRSYLSGNENNELEYKIREIYNGFDSEDFRNINVINDATDKNLFKINYVGTWGYSTSPMNFLAALNKLLIENESLNSQIRVNFIGGVKYDPELRNRIYLYIKKNNLEKVINWVEFIPHKEALRYLKSADVLLAVVGRSNKDTQFYKYRVLAKIFEYLYVRKPILFLGIPNGETARIIKECNSGEIVDPDNISCISDKIYDMYSAWKLGKLKYNFNMREIEKYDRRKQTMQLANIFNSLL